MLKNKLVFALLSLSFSLSGLVLAEDKPPGQTPAPIEIPDPVAIVNDVPISKALYQAYARQRRAQLGETNTAEARQSLTDELVIQELLAQEANKQQLTNDPQVAMQIEIMRRNLLASTVVRKLVQERKPSEEEIKKAYESAVATMDKKEYKARHILVDSEDKAKDVIAELKKGTDFSELAKSRSSDDSSAVKGGDLDWFTSDTMVEPFGEVVSKLQKGKFTEQPVQTRFGWHVIILDDTRDATPPTLEEMRPEIMQTLQTRMIEKYLETLRAGAKIQIK